MEIRIKRKDGKSLTLPGKKYQFEEIDFWRAFLKGLDMVANEELSKPEIKIMSYILTGSPFKSYFKKPNVQKLLEFMGWKNYQNLWQFRKGLEERGLLEFTGEVRGDFLPGKNLRKFQMQLKEMLKEGTVEEVEIVIPVKIIK